MTTTANSIVNAWINPTLPDIFYEEPERIEDAMLQELPLEYITRLLRQRYEGREDVFISGRVFVSYDRSNGNARVAPDLFIAFGVPAAVIRKRLPNFWLWETGKAPDFALEVASKSTAANDLGSKRRLYERLGILEYWRLDPSPGAGLYGQPLAGDRLADGRYVPVQPYPGAGGSTRAFSKLLELEFHWSEATGFDLLDQDTGRTIDRMTAIAERAEAERDTRLNAETQRNAAEKRADAAESRARQLEEEIRRLREGG